MTVARTRGFLLALLVGVDVAATSAGIMWKLPPLARFGTIALCLFTAWLAWRNAKATK